MRTTEEFKLAIAWLIGCLAAVIVGLAPVSEALSRGHYLPVGADAFYHARRILDTVADPFRFFQFDHLMHAPDGALVTWPWAYDWTLSLIVRFALFVHPGADPLAILDHLPVLGFAVAQTLMLAICRQLRVSAWATLVALLATAFFPLNQINFGVADFHHHFAEQLFVLAALPSGVAWLLSMTSAQMLAAAPDVKYVFVERYNLSRMLPDGTMQFVPRGNPDNPDLPLVQELLAARSDSLPPHFRLLKELFFQGVTDAPYARLFVLDRN